MPLSQSYGPQVVGLYGVGGIGKTTACKYLCEDLFMKFGGKVCYVEFGSGITEEYRLQEVLKRLTNTNKKVLKSLNKQQVYERDHLKSGGSTCIRLNCVMIINYCIMFYIIL